MMKRPTRNISQNAIFTIMSPRFAMRSYTTHTTNPAESILPAPTPTATVTPPISHSLPLTYFPISTKDPSSSKQIQSFWSIFQTKATLASATSKIRSHLHYPAYLFPEQFLKEAAVVFTSAMLAIGNQDPVFLKQEGNQGVELWRNPEDLLPFMTRSLAVRVSAACHSLESGHLLVLEDEVDQGSPRKKEEVENKTTTSPTRKLYPVIRIKETHSNISPWSSLTSFLKKTTSTTPTATPLTTAMVPTTPNAKDQDPQDMIQTRIQTLSNNLSLSIEKIQLVYGPWPVPPGYMAQEWLDYLTLVIPEKEATFHDMRTHGQILEDAQKEGMFIKITCLVDGEMTLSLVDASEEAPAQDSFVSIGTDSSRSVVKEWTRSRIPVEFVSPIFGPHDELFRIDPETGEWKLGFSWRISDLDHCLSRS